MTNTNPRDLIQRLADALHDAADDVEGWGNYATNYFQKKHDLSGNVARIRAQADEARAYLDQSEPERPKDEELLAAQDQAVASFPPIHPEAEPLSAVEYARELEIRKARAILALKPVPVSERSPKN